MSEVKERPISFRADMVNAILANKKTQTRRVIDARLIPYQDDPPAHPDEWWVNSGRRCSRTSNWRGTLAKGARLYDGKYDSETYLPKMEWWQSFCPYGQPGDRLWVKEVWTGTWHPTRRGDTHLHLHYSSDGSERFIDAPQDYVLPKAAAKPGNFVTPLFMPRWASRITLEITDVRVQRLQEMSEEDAIAEGVAAAVGQEAAIHKQLRRIFDPSSPNRMAFSYLWDSINEKHGYGWETNLWVWALTFKRVEADHA